MFLIKSVNTPGKDREKVTQLTWLGGTSLLPKYTLRSLLICISNSMKIHKAEGSEGVGWSKQMLSFHL